MIIQAKEVHLKLLSFFLMTTKKYFLGKIICYFLYRAVFFFLFLQNFEFKQKILKLKVTFMNNC